MNVRCVAIVASAMQEAGLPDRFFAHPSIPGGAWIEFKAEDGRLRECQRLCVLDFLERGVNAMIVRFMRNGDLRAEVPARGTDDLNVIDVLSAPFDAVQVREWLGRQFTPTT